MKLLSIFSLLSMFNGSANIVLASTTFECWAQGNKLRQTNTSSKENIVGGRFYAVLEVSEDEVEATLKRYHGHLEIGERFKDSPTLDSASSYYGVFLGKEKEATLSPRASKYKDADYFRFREFKADGVSNGDGGYMSGELVISKKLLTVKEADKFDAHYVFQAGDHMGGTVDLNCARTW